LTVAFEKLADHVILCELDPEVVAVWRFITSSDYMHLANEIMKFQVSEANVRRVLSETSKEDCDVAFRTIVRNRMQHGGILAPGASLMKSGENGKGLTSRWYPKTLAMRIEAIGEIRSRFTIVEGDGIQLIDDHKQKKSTATFIDPPYTAAGKMAGSRLYRHSELDHKSLFSATQKLRGDFLMTYDNADGVRDLATNHGFDVEPVAMKNTHHAKMTELLIGRDLSWARKAAGNDSQLSLLFD